MDDGKRSGFTLVEILVVIAIIGILLGVAVSAFSSSGTSERRAARGEVLSLLTRARSHAISSGQPTALALVGLGNGPEDMRGQALTLFEVKRTQTGDGWVVVEQLRRWVHLPGKTVLLDEKLAGGTSEKGTNVLDSETLLESEVPEGPSGRMTAAALPFVVFESTGAVSHPPGSGRIEFLIGEEIRAARDGGGLVLKDKLAWPKFPAGAERLVLAVDADGKIVTELGAEEYESGERDGELRYLVSAKGESHRPDGLPDSEVLSRLEVSVETPPAAKAEDRRKFVFVQLLHRDD